MNKLLFILTLLAITGCARADCCAHNVATWTSTGDCNNCDSGAITTYCCASISATAVTVIKIPDIKNAPKGLPNFDEVVLVWSGEQWLFGRRTSTDKEGEKWKLTSAVGFFDGLSQQHPMWQSLPADPQGTPMCAAVIEGKSKAWKPRDGLCKIEDAGK